MSKGRHRSQKPQKSKKPVYRQWEHEPLRPEETDPKKRYGFWQQVAAKTNGVLAPAMPVTAAGNAAAAIGIVEACNGRPLVGAAWFAGGRIGDFLDGKIARITKTASSMGEAFDVGFDKLQAIVGMGALWVYGLYPTEAMVPKTTTQLAITVAGALAIKSGIELHPGKAGKINMGATTASMASFIAANAVPASQEVLHNTLEYGGGYGLTAVSIAAGGVAVWGYACDVKNGRRQAHSTAIAPVAEEAWSNAEWPTQDLRLPDDVDTTPLPLNVRLAQPHYPSKEELDRYY